jgi:ribosomal protein S18 acetylase RimI-like enzyme
MDIRNAVAADDAALEVLLQAYMQESFGRPWGGSLQALARARAEGAVHVLVAGDVGAPIAFAAWITSYDLQRCVSGGEILDVYVSAWDRGRGMAARLVMRVAADVQKQGGAYVRGQATSDSTVQRLYERVAVSHPGANIHVGGRAFRALAALSGASPRAILQALPDRSWNDEP